MKKFLSTSLLLFSTAIFAYNHTVGVKITNATGTDCVLEKQIVTHGYISDPLTIPDAIFSDQTMTFTMRSYDGHRKSILLAYACGENRTATIYTDINHFQGMSLSDGYAIKSNKIHLYFTEEHNETGRFYDNSPIVVSWRLTR